MTSFYHRTTQEAARAILAEGFRDQEGFYMTDQVLKGVWVSNTPLNENEGAHGEVLFEITTLLSEAEFDDYEVKEEGKPYREWLLPAALLNTHCSVRQVSAEEEQHIEDPRFPRIA